MQLSIILTALRESNEDDPDSKVKYIDIDNVSITLLDNGPPKEVYVLSLPPNVDQPFMLLDAHCITVDTADDEHEPRIKVSSFLSEHFANIISKDFFFFSRPLQVMFKDLVLGNNRKIFYHSVRFCFENMM